MKKADTRTEAQKAAQNKKENEARIKKMKEMYSMFLKMERGEDTADEAESAKEDQSNPAANPSF